MNDPSTAVLIFYILLAGGAACATMAIGYYAVIGVGELIKAVVRWLRKQ